MSDENIFFAEMPLVVRMACGLLKLSQNVLVRVLHQAVNTHGHIIPGYMACAVTYINTYTVKAMAQHHWSMCACI